MPYRDKHPCVYMLASRRNGTLYIGVTSDLHQRVALHKQGLIEGFTKKYRVHLLVYYETHPTMDAAIRREKQLKEWRRFLLWGQLSTEDVLDEAMIRAALDPDGRFGASELGAGDLNAVPLFDLDGGPKPVKGAVVDMTIAATFDTNSD